MKKIIFLLGFLVLGIYLFVKVLLETGLDTIWSAFSTFNIWHLGVLLALTAFNFSLYTWRSFIILKHFQPKHKVRFKSMFMGRIAGFSVSYLTPSAQIGGEPVRIFFLNKDGVKMKNSVATIIVDKVLEITAFILVSIIGVAIGFQMGLFDGKIEVILWRSLIGAIIFLFLLYYAMFFRSGFISKLMRILGLDKFKKFKKAERKIAEVENLMSDFVTGHKARFHLLMALSIFNVVVFIFEHFILAFFLGALLSPMQSLLVTAIPNLSYLIPIPGAFGALESMHAAMFSLLGIGISAVALVLIIRVRDLFLVTIGIVYASGHGLHMLKDAFKGLAKK